MSRVNRFASDLLSRIFLYLIEPVYERPIFHRKAFRVSAGGTLAANVSDLNDTGQMLAQRALMAWTEATGIRFHKIQCLAGIQAGNEGYSIEQVN